MRWGSAVAAVMAGAVVAAGMTGCTAGGASPTTVTPAEPRLADGQERHSIGATFQSGAFLVTVGELVLDRDVETLYLGIRMTNLSDEEWQQAAPEAVLQTGGQQRRMFTDRSPRVPPGHRTELTGQIDTRGGDPFPDGVLVWGRADQWQTEIRLADGQVVSGGLVPVEVPVDAWGQIGRHTVHVYAGRLYSDAVHASRPEPGQRALRLYLDEYTSRTSPVNGFFPADHFQLRWPDGHTVEPLRGSAGRGPQSWTVHTGHWVDIPVPADPVGDYQLLLASVSRHAFGLPRPELIERVPISFRIEDPASNGAADAATAASAAEPADPLPWPVLPPPDDPAGDPVELAVSSGEVNVPGFGYTPTVLRWDPSTATVTLTGTARLLPPVESPDPTDLFFTPSRFSFLAVLVSADRIFEGMHVGIGQEVTLDRPAEVSYEFRQADVLDLADVTLLIGSGSMPASVIPLTAGSRFTLDPATPEVQPISAPPAIAGDYTVQLVGYRFGLPGEHDRPPAGRRALEVIYDVTVSPTASQRITGLGFRSRAQLFIAHPHGYLQQPEQHSGDITGLEPGETVRSSATYYVTAWQPGRIGFAVRSMDENTAVGGDRWWIETTFAADFAGAASLPPGSEF
jgi:hypothetical protein